MCTNSNHRKNHGPPYLILVRLLCAIVSLFSRLFPSSLAVSSLHRQHLPLDLLRIGILLLLRPANVLVSSVAAAALVFFCSGDFFFWLRFFSPAKKNNNNKRKRRSRRYGCCCMENGGEFRPCSGFQLFRSSSCCCRFSAAATFFFCCCCYGSFVQCEHRQASVLGGKL